jgi:Fe-S-cluster containining protein
MFFKKIDETVKGFLQKQEVIGKKPACEKSCSECCKKVPLIATKLEIELIAKKLNSLNKNMQKTIKNNIKKLDKKYYTNEHGKSYKNMSDIDNSQALALAYHCAFLIGNSCSIYEVRPQVCRSYFSSNKELCLNHGTGDMIMKDENIELLSYYKEYFPHNFYNNELLLGHVHRNIAFSNGQFISVF